MMQVLPLETKSTSAPSEQDRLVVFVDADNTLWDTNAIYAAAQLGLLRDVEKLCERQVDPSDRLGYVRQVDQELARKHHLGLRYPPNLLVRAIALALSGLDTEAAAVGAWRLESTTCGVSEEEIQQVALDYQTALGEIPTLNSGVLPALTELCCQGAQIVIVTEGNRDRVARTLVVHGIATRVHKVIEAKKTPKLFSRLLSAIGKSSTTVMIGDQLTRDVIPASEAGFRTILIPGGFQPQWETEKRVVRPDIVLSSFSDVPRAVISLVCDGIRSDNCSCDQEDRPTRASPS